MCVIHTTMEPRVFIQRRQSATNIVYSNALLGDLYIIVVMFLLECVFYSYLFLPHNNTFHILIKSIMKLLSYFS